MTSASELFYSRRSRIGRNSADLGLDSLPSPDRPWYARRYPHHRHDLDACDPLRRYPHSRSSFNNRSSSSSSHQERGSFRLEESTTPFSSGGRAETGDLIGTSGSAAALDSGERLPGAVLLARARLRERLRGVPLPGTRSHVRVSSSVSRGGIRPGDGSNHSFDSSDLETENLAGWWSTNSSTSVVPSSQILRLQSSRELNKKPIGLTQETLNCLQLEHFSNSKETDSEKEEAISKSARDCSICLEGFVSGDELICLPCDHRFHSGCLHPWVRICGDCPYCRRVIVVKKRTDMDAL